MGTTRAPALSTHFTYAAATYDLRTSFQPNYTEDVLTPSRAEAALARPGLGAGSSIARKHVLPHARTHLPGQWLHAWLSTPTRGRLFGRAAGAAPGASAPPRGRVHRPAAAAAVAHASSTPSVTPAPGRAGAMGPRSAAGRRPRAAPRAVWEEDGA